METYSSGAKRQKKLPNYSNIKLILLDRVAAVMNAGEVKYGKDNWTKGGQDFIDDIPAHILQHVFLYMQGDTSEDHLANIACNVMMMMYLLDQEEEMK